MASPQLPYDLFVASVAGLPVRDIQASCASNKLWSSYCHNTQFWRDVIQASFDINLEEATLADYRFLQEISLIERNYPVRPNPAVQELSEKVVDFFTEEEIEAWLNGSPLKYYTVNPLFFINKYKDPLEGIFFEAYTLGGALLKLNQHIPVDNKGGDFLYRNAENYLTRKSELPREMDYLAEILDFPEEQQAPEFILRSYGPDSILNGDRRTDCLDFVIVAVPQIILM